MKLLEKIALLEVATAWCFLLWWRCGGHESVFWWVFNTN